MNTEISKEKLAIWDQEYLVVSVEKHKLLESFYLSTKVANVEELDSMLKENPNARVFELTEVHPVDWYISKLHAKEIKQQADLEIAEMQRLMQKHIKQPEVAKSKIKNGTVITLSAPK